MITPSDGPTEPIGSSRSGRLLGGRRRRLALGLVVLLVAAGAVIGVTDPFATKTGSGDGVHDNGYPTGTTTVKRESLTSQTQVDATLGYEGSYTVSIPAGTAQSDIEQARTTLQSDEAQVADEKAALTSAESEAAPEVNSTMTSARETVSSDETTLDEARNQLAEDERLGCPAASSATVTTAASGSSPGSSGNSNDDDNGDSDNGDNGNSSSPSGTTGSGSKGSPSGSSSPSGGTGTGDPAPTVSTGSATSVTPTSETLTGTVDPGGADTTYDFEWGATSALGHETPAHDLGEGTSDVSVTATVKGLKPGTTYEYALVATNAAGTSVGDTETFQTADSSCVAERAVIASDEMALGEAKDSLSEDELDGNPTVTQDQEELRADEVAAKAAAQALSQDEEQSTNPNTTFTTLPSEGAIIHRGQSVYSLNKHPVPLFYGAITPYRALYLGVSPGPDVTELQRNLIALGFGSGITASPDFTAATEQAVKAWQASLGEAPTGVVSLGDVVVEPGPIQVDTVSASLGEQAQAATEVLTATSRTPEVTIDLDASQQSEVKVGDPVTITLPNNDTTPGVVSSVGTVATSSSGAGNTGGSSSPTITVEVTPTHLAASAGIDQAPVLVSITTASAHNVLVVPVDALLALSSGGYAVEAISPKGTHYYVAVSLGLFDDAAGTVQVTGAGLYVGLKVVVPEL